MLFNVTVDLDEPAFDPDTADKILDALTGFHPAISVHAGWLSATISLPAESLDQAFRSGVALVERATGHQAIAVEVLTSDEFDRRNGLEPVPELMSVTEIAEEYGITRQAVNGLIERKRFATAQRVGSTWAVSRQEVLVKKPRTADEHAAAIARGSQGTKRK